VILEASPPIDPINAGAIVVKAFGQRGANAGPQTADLGVGETVASA
jgi:hypothetical protein